VAGHKILGGVCRIGIIVVTAAKSKQSSNHAAAGCVTNLSLRRLKHYAVLSLCYSTEQTLR
jgi:hypothetical protein